MDYDKINLLLDTLKYRIGASGRERQSKLTYHFKSIVNTLFPALYRYILYSCMLETDYFSKGQPKPTEWNWTNELMEKLQMDPNQIEYIKTFKDRLVKVYTDTINGIARLNNIKERMREEGMKV